MITLNPIVAQESNGSVITAVEPASSPSKPYGNLDNSINVHSWIPYYNTISKDLSLTLYSTNLFNTTVIVGTYVYNKNEKTHLGIGSIVYQGLFPIFSLSGSYGGRTSTLDIKQNNKTKTEFYKYNERKVTLDMYLPFNFSRSLWTNFLIIGLNGSYSYIEDSESSRALELDSGSLVPFGAFGSLSVVKNRFGYIVPYLGFTTTTAYTRLYEKKSDYNGSMISTVSTIYFPGMFARNSLYVQGAYEKQIVDSAYHFESDFLFPRGYEYSFHENMYKGSANYTFPVLYPNLNLLWIAYIKRIYVNAFGDYGVSYDDHNRSLFRSAGAEIMFEINPVNMPLSVHVGLQYSRTFDADYKSDTGIVFAIDSSNL